jgi:signal transduction histidine kinase
VLDEILALHGEHLKKRNIEVVIHPSLPRFFFDHLQLTQIFQNLITNAAKFMGDQPRPKIEIGGTERNGFVEFYVKDNGIGIDPSYHEKIFAIFQRLQDVKVEGTGVGLSIVKKIIDLSGGKVWIESQRGTGATFFLQLPKKT